MGDFDLTASSTASSDNTTTDKNPAADTVIDPDPNTSDNIEADGVSTDLGAGEPTTEKVVVEGEVVRDTAEPVVREAEFVDTNFFYPTELDPMRQVPGTSQYLDRKMREDAEVLRAKVEGREPDLVNPPASQSTPLVNENLFARGAVPDGLEAVVLPVAQTVPLNETA